LKRVRPSSAQADYSHDRLGGSGRSRRGQRAKLSPARLTSLRENERQQRHPRLGKRGHGSALERSLSSPSPLRASCMPLLSDSVTTAAAVVVLAAVAGAGPPPPLPLAGPGYPAKPAWGLPPPSRRPREDDGDGRGRKRRKNHVVCSLARSLACSSLAGFPRHQTTRERECFAGGKGRELDERRCTQLWYTWFV